MSINKLGHYIWRRIQKDNSDPKFRKKKPQDMMSGLFLGPSDIQKYVNDYFDYGIAHHLKWYEKIEKYISDGFCIMEVGGGFGSLASQGLEVITKEKKKK